MDVPFVGVGMSAGGVISPHDGSVVSALESMMPGWGGLPISARMGDALSVQATVLNDVHPRRLGEAIENDDYRAETIMSGTAIAAAYQGKQPGEELDDTRMGDYISVQAEAGEEQAIEVLTRAGRSLGEAIGAWCALIDPECVILSGSVTKSPQVWHDALRAGFEDQAMTAMKDTPLMYAMLGDKAPLYGAAEHIVDKVVR